MKYALTGDRKCEKIKENVSGEADMEKLKVVIADDEERICRLIEVLIDWENLGMEIAGVARNGIEAYEAVQQHRPDILITDIRMPGMSGLELIEKVKGSCPQIEIIVISGYAHFEYAQQAIRFGVGHYLLKPINKAELTETLVKLRERIGQRQETERDRQVLRQKDQENREYLRSRLFSAMLDGTGPVLTGQILEQEYGIVLKPGLMQLFCLKMDCEEEALGSSSVAILMSKALEILERSLCGKCLEAVMEIRGFYCIGLLNYESRRQEEIRRMLKNCLSQIELQKAIFKSAEFSMAAGSICRTPEELGASALQVRRLIRQRLVKGSGRLLEPQESYTSFQSENLLEKYVREITHAVEVMSTELADGAADFLQQKVNEARNPRGCDILDLVYSAADVFTACIQLTDRAECLEKFRRQCEQCGSTEKLFGLLRTFQQTHIRQLEERRENERVRPIRKAKEYIQSHYGEPITQEEVSNAVGLSPAYFSALFKKTEGEGFARYLIHVRIEQAKILLRESNLPVTEICRRVGYNDLKHFTQTFEKVTEVKPSTYRKLYG